MNGQRSGETSKRAEMPGQAPLQAKFFTICAANYLANAIALGRSLSETHDGSRLTVFLLDDLPTDVAGIAQIDAVAAKEIMPVAEWHHYQCFYNILELATSIKPICFDHLFSDKCDIAIYLDPDIIIFKPLERIFAAAREGHDIVLTPHILTPLPDDGKMPDDLAIMRSGIYNMGFVAFANTPRCHTIIAWWRRQLRTKALSDVAAGLFTDQKWIDFVPAFVPAAFIVHDPGYNVAYWNLHERTVVRLENGWRIDFSDGSQNDLTFFHFSGYSPSSAALSKHENRFRNKPPGATRQLLALYSERLAAAGHDTLMRRAIAEPSFKNGATWDPICRLLYRDILSVDPDFGDPLDGDAFLRFAADVALSDHVPRYARAVLRLRPDVALAYDDGRNRAGLAAWLARDGAAQLGIAPALLRHVGLQSDLVTGVNYVGYFRSHLGIGEAARNAVAALRVAGLEATEHDISRFAESPTGTYAVGTGASRSPYPITILGVNADQTPGMLNIVPSDLHSTFLIGCWAWETPEFPEEWCDRFNLVDEVWVASTFVAEAVRAKATVPVFVVPYAVAVPDVKPDKPWLAATCPNVEPTEFTFVCFFDVGSISFRKNPHGAIEAFKRAFRPHEPVRMIVKAINGERDAKLLKTLAEETAGHRVTIWDAALESLDRFRLLASIDAFVSLHRSEGFGLVIAEAMAMGKPVIVTNWSGNADFTNNENAALVRHDLVRSEEDHGPYPAGTLWAEADLDDAARQMRRIWEDQPWRNTIAAAAAKDIARFSPQRVGAIIKDRLERLSVSTRQYRRTQEGLLPSTAKAGGNAPITGALKVVSEDALRRPLFYAARAPRLPRLLWNEGPRRLFDRVALHAQDRDIVARRAFSFRDMIARIWLVFTRGWADQQRRR